jgi:hypothetical protein
MLISGVLEIQKHFTNYVLGDEMAIINPEIAKKIATSYIIMLTF